MFATGPVDGKYNAQVDMTQNLMNKLEKIYLKPVLWYLDVVGVSPKTSPNQTSTTPRASKVESFNI